MQKERNSAKEKDIYMAKTTNNLLHLFVNGRDFKRVLDKNEDEFKEQSISEYLQRLCAEREMVPGQVIQKSQIDRTYGHQIFNGTRVPSRDKLIQLAFGMGLSLDETQKLLKISGKGALYAKIKRDAACIFGISHGMSVMEVQELLASIEVPLLGEV